MSSRRLGSLVLGGLLIILCHHVPETLAAVEAKPRQLQASTNVTNTNANVTVAVNTNTSTTPATTTTETQLSQPDCLAVGNEFICEINLLLEELSDGTPTDKVVVDAALTCPLNTAPNTTAVTNVNVTWSDVDPRTCGCVAALSYPDGGQAAKECPCRYCSSGVEGRTPLSIDCSALTENPFVQGTCQHVGCDGSCLDPANSTAAPAANTTTPPETPEPTPDGITPPPRQTDPPDTTTTEPSPLSNGTCIMDFPFCPENRQVPEANLDIMIDPILERTCGSLHENRRGPMVNVDCDSLKSYGALCCTEDIVEQVDTTPPRETSPPTKVGTQIITIPSLFRVYNLYNLSAAPLMEGPEWETMQVSYAAFVELVVLEKLLLDGDTTDNSTTSSVNGGSSSNTTEPSASNTTATRYLRGRQILLTEDELQHQQKEEAALSAVISHSHRRRRRLQVLLDSSSIQVHSFNNTECPTTIPFEALCVAVHASYDLFVYQDINSNDTIYEDYTNYTQEAVDRGLLNQTMEAVDPYTVLIVEGSLPIDTDDSPEEPDNYVQGSGYKEYWMVGLGVSITIIVFCLVAILCASDWSGNDMDDDDSVDPWEKESKAGGSKASLSKSGSKASLHSKGSSHKERAPRRGKRGNDDDDDDKTDKQTERQEYEMYRAQIEELIEKKTPEELDNIDELMDLFYQRELILIATLKHMPDAFDGIVGEELGIPESSSGSSSEEFGEEKKNENMNTTEERLEDSMFWNDEDGSSGEFAEESSPHLSVGGNDSDDDEEKKNDKKFHRGDTAPIAEGDEDEDSTNRSDADPEPIVAKKAAEPVLEEESDEEDEVDASETKNDKTALSENAESDSDNDEQEDTTEPTPDAQADSAEAGGEASDDDSGNAAEETWDDEDAQENEQSKTPSPPPTPSEEKDSDDDGDLD